MRAFEIKTEKSDSPYMVVADNFIMAVDTLKKAEVITSANDIVNIRKLDNFGGDHILVEAAITDKEKMRQQIREELLEKLPQWKHFGNGACGGGNKDIYLIRTSDGHYFTSSCLSAGNCYLELKSLENLSGIQEDR